MGRRFIEALIKQGRHIKNKLKRRRIPATSWSSPTAERANVSTQLFSTNDKDRAVSTSTAGAFASGGDATSRAPTDDPRSTTEDASIGMASLEADVAAGPISSGSGKSVNEVLRENENRRDSGVPRLYLGSSGVFDAPATLQPQISAVTTCTAITTRKDGGEEFTDAFLSERGNQEIPDNEKIPVPECPTGPGMLKWMKSALGAAEVRSDDDENRWFVPCTSLAQIINYENVQRMLEACSRANGAGEQVVVASQICPRPQDNAFPFKKVLGVLISIDKHESIKEFINHDPPIHDKVMPLHLVTRDGKPQGLSFVSSPDHIIPFTKTWEGNELKDFNRLQWHLYPLFFAVDGDKNKRNHTKVHYDCPHGMILPFVHDDSPSADNSRSSTWNTSASAPVNTNRTLRRAEIEGGFSRVSFRKVHPLQQNLKRYTSDGVDRLVAVKQLKSSIPEMFEKEYSMLVKLTPLPTPHLAKLLASYEIPVRPRPSATTTRHFFLMFECADCNLRDLWKTDPSSQLYSNGDKIPSVNVARWVATQCLALANALSMIHDYKHDSESDMVKDLASHGFHGDIKPANILVYRNWVGHEDPLGILQITDFGISSFHHTSSALDINSRLHGHQYQPPDSQLVVMKVPQSLDIWTLGCLFLDFLSWLVKGPTSFEEFEDMRRSPGLVASTEIFYYDLKEENSTTVVTISQGVLEWANKLCRADNSSQFVCDFVELITRQMLVIENTGFRPTVAIRTEKGQQSDQAGHPTQRIPATELVKRLEALVGCGDDYYQTVQKHPDLGKHDEGRQAIYLPLPFVQLKKEAQREHSQRYPPMYTDADKQRE